MITAQELAKLFDKAQRGATLLDEKNPAWLALVNPDILDMGDVRRCVLGQAYAEHTTGYFTNGYAAGTHKLDLYGSVSGLPAPFPSDDRLTHHYGFNTSIASFQPLAGVWLTIIAARRNPVYQRLANDGWYLSRDCQTMVSPATGEEHDLASDVPIGTCVSVPLNVAG